MTIIDDARDWQQAIADRDAARQQLADAALQHGNDQQAIADLRAEIATDERTMAGDIATITSLKAQLAKLQSLKVYDQLEFAIWKQTDTKDSKVGGSGLGTAWQKQPGIEMAELGIDPFPPVAPKTANFYDCYYTQDFLPLNDAITRWTMETTFIFPTQADIDACNCLELEMRQVLLVPKGLMFVAGAQLNRGSNTLRYWSHGTKPDGSEKGWQASGKPCPTFVPLKPMQVLVTGHRDAQTIYHDYISIDSVKVVDLTGTSYPAWTELSPWRQMLRCAIQLDGKEASVPNQFRVKIGNSKFTVSQ